MSKTDEDKRCAAPYTARARGTKLSEEIVGFARARASRFRVYQAGLERALAMCSHLDVGEFVKREDHMKRLVLAALITSLAVGSAYAQSCSVKAVGKDGKALAGAAKTSFMKKCCEESAMGKDGKMLSGAAKTSYVTKCEKGG